MFAFGHAGLTLGAGLIAKKSLGKRGAPKRFLESTDLRVLIIGSLLPDIIDKPVGLILFARSIGYGRIFCHTLIFFSVLTIAGLWLNRKRHQTWLLTLAIVTGGHLILDEMWAYPWTLFYPFYGWGFPREDISSYIQILMYELTSNPAAYIPEILGFLTLIAFAVRLVKNKRLWAFVLKGSA